MTENVREVFDCCWEAYEEGIVTPGMTIDDLYELRSDILEARLLDTSHLSKWDIWEGFTQFLQS